MTTITKRFLALWITLVALVLAAATAPAAMADDHEPNAAETANGVADPGSDDGNGNGNGNANGTSEPNGQANGQANQPNGQANGHVNGDAQANETTPLEATATPAATGEGAVDDVGGDAGEPAVELDPNEGNDDSTSESSQQTATDQTAGSDATATQENPSNDDVTVRVDDPGNNAPVTQGNDSTAAALAGNDNQASQSSNQSGEADDDDEDSLNGAVQSQDSQQAGSAAAKSKQKKPKNKHVDVRVASHGDNAPVNQENSSSATAIASNDNNSSQSSAGDFSGGDDANTDAASVSSTDDPSAVEGAAEASDTPSAPLETASEEAAGDGGAVVTEPAAQSDVDLTVDVTVVTPAEEQPSSPQEASGGESAPSEPANVDLTVEVAVGTQAPTDSATTTELSSGPEALTPDPIAESNQNVSIVQEADAEATATQEDPSNVNVSVRVLSPGDNGPVTQTNTSTADALAANENTTGQSATHAEDAVEEPAAGLIAQHDGTVQDASAQATATQTQPTNTNVIIRVLSPGEDGIVTQTSTATAIADATVTDGAAQVVAGVDPALEQPLVEQSSDGAQLGGWVAVETQTDPLNTNVFVSVDPNATLDPATVFGDVSSGTWDWTWDWTWEEPTTNWDGVINPESLVGGDWDWSDEGDTQAETPTTSTTGTPGTWTWMWNWTWLQDDGQAWDWQWTWTKPCACDWTWEWNWEWDWTAAPVVPQSTASNVAWIPPQVETTPFPAGPGDHVEVEQVNQVFSLAGALNSNTVIQESTQTRTGTEPELSQSVTQSVETVQLAEATTVASQSDAGHSSLQLGIGDGFAGAGIAEKSPNEVSQTSTASALTLAQNTSGVFQGVVQEQIVLFDADDFFFGFLGTNGPKAQVANQSVTVAQQAGSTAVVEQKSPGGNVPVFTNAALAESRSGNEFLTVQEIEQTQVAGAGPLLHENTVQVASQEASVTQANTASTSVTTTGPYIQASSFAASFTSTIASQHTSQYQEVGNTQPGADGDGNGAGTGAGSGAGAGSGQTPGRPTGPAEGTGPNPPGGGSGGGGSETPGNEVPGGEVPGGEVPGETPGGESPNEDDGRSDGGRNATPGESAVIGGALLLELLLAAGLGQALHAAGFSPGASRRLGPRGDAGGGGGGGSLPARSTSAPQSCACGSGGSASAGSGGSAASFMTVIAFPDLVAPPPGRPVDQSLAFPPASDFVTDLERPG